MSTELFPTYKYKPRPLLGALLQSFSSRRARLFNQTYFRSKEYGPTANNISVSIDTDLSGSFCVVTNKNFSDETIIGKATSKFVRLKGVTYEDLWVISNLNSTALINYYSISLRIRNEIQNGDPYILPTPTYSAAFFFDKPFADTKLSMILSRTDQMYSNTDVVLITPRIETYELLGLPDGFDADDLRSQILSGSKWIEMPVRGVDQQDLGGIDLPLTTFDETNLSGGDGLPEGPTALNTGEFRTLVHQNYGEQPNGTLAEVNIVYEWVGESSANGSWV